MVPGTAVPANVLPIAQKVGVDLCDRVTRGLGLIGAAEQARKETLAALKDDPKRAARHRLKPLGTSLAAEAQ